MDDPSNSSVPPMTSLHSHEMSDVAIRPLATFLVWLVMGLAAVALLMAWLFYVLLDSTNTEENLVPVVVAPEEPFTAPELQVSPRRELERFREHEAKVLASSEWINREKGVVRIPIEQAIKIIAERGFPDWPKADVTPPVPQPAESNAVTPISPQAGGSP